MTIAAQLRSLVFLAAGLGLLQAATCPLGSYYNSADGMCYVVSNKTMPWASALNFCAVMGGQLVVPKNAFDNSVFSSVLQDVNILGSWIGAFSNDVGTWFNAVTGLPLTYYRWAPREPSSNGSCASVGSDGLWFADQCDLIDDFVCQINPNIGVVTPSTSRPTLPSTQYPTLPTAYPTVGPNPTSCPGYTTMNGTTPCASGWHFYLPTCSCYYVYSGYRTWYEAENYCVNKQAHLTSIHSQEEAVLVMGLVSSTRKLILIGLEYIGNMWIWSDGTPVSFLNWAPRTSRPDYKTYACAGIYSDGYYFAGYMGNYLCNVNYDYFVCKKPLV